MTVGSAAIEEQGAASEEIPSKAANIRWGKRTRMVKTLDDMCCLEARLIRSTEPMNTSSSGRPVDLLRAEEYVAASN